MRRENIMARRDWTKLQAEYEAAFNKTGITIKSWCDEKGINYNSARRYLKVITKSDQSAKKEPKLRTLSNDTSNKPSAKPVESDQFDGGEDEKNVGKSKAASNSAQSDHLNCAQKGDQTDHFEKMLPPSQRNHLGHFLPGNTIANKHSAYAQRLGDLDAIFDAKRTAIDDEIEMCRARVMLAMDKYREIEAELQGENLSVTEKIKLWELYQATDAAIDRNVARVESLLRTKANVRKSELESERIASEQAGLGTAIADIVAEVQAMDSNGFVVQQ
ncbi:hypothetical protein CTH30272_04098 [Allocatenococcus thiocycli]|nr:hypothetical protein CTH30272_04098 [Catenococcus thiocycli]